MSVRALLIRVALVVFAASILTSAVAGLIVKGLLDDNNAVAANRLFVAQAAGCVRQNLRTQNANTNALDSWSVDTIFAGALKRPQDRPQTAAQKRIVQEFLAAEQDSIASFTWTPINLHCSTDPTAVQLSVAFEERLPSSADVTLQGEKRLAELRAARR